MRAHCRREGVCVRRSSGVQPRRTPSGGSELLNGLTAGGKNNSLSGKLSLCQFARPKCRFRNRSVVIFVATGSQPRKSRCLSAHHNRATLTLCLQELMVSLRVAVFFVLSRSCFRLAAQRRSNFSWDGKLRHYVIYFRTCRQSSRRYGCSFIAALRAGPTGTEVDGRPVEQAALLGHREDWRTA